MPGSKKKGLLSKNFVKKICAYICEVVIKKSGALHITKTLGGFM